VVPGGIGLGRAQPLGEADQHHPGRGRDQGQVVGRGHPGQAERGQAAVDPPDDLDPVAVQAEDLHGDDAGQDRGQRAGHDRRQAAQSQH
jgi:hypothetical protein